MSAKHYKYLALLAAIGLATAVFRYCSSRPEYLANLPSPALYAEKYAFSKGVRQIDGVRLSRASKKKSDNTRFAIYVDNPDFLKDLANHTPRSFHGEPDFMYYISRRLLGKDLVTVLEFDHEGRIISRRAFEAHVISISGLEIAKPRGYPWE
jgi:hypothetical protein